MQKAVFNKFNRGEVDPNALARDDVKPISNSAALMNNFIPQRLGPMQYRPGTKYLGDLLGVTYLVPFIRAIDDIYLLEFSNNLLRVWFEDSLVARTAVSTTIVNGNFTGSLSDWTDDDGTGASSVWVAGGYMGLTGTGSTSASRYQTVTSTEADAEHGIRIVTLRGPVRFRIGTSGKNSTEILDTTLYPGTHSFAFTPDSNFTITISNSEEYQSLVDSVVIESAGTMTLPTSVGEAELANLRYAQSAGVMYFAYGEAPFQVNRRGDKSWSIVDFRADDGPFGAINGTDVTMTAGALTGDTTLTASVDYFTSDMVGRLFKLGSSGQEVTDSTSSDADGTGNIRVTGVGGVRAFSVSVSGTFTATVTLQRSPDESTWEDIANYTTATSTTYNDALDNAVLYYRLWIKTGNYTSGTAVLKLTYTSGSIDGICRITAYTSETLADIQVLEDFGSTSATVNWYAGSWTVGSYPTAVSLYEGRLWWAGKSKIWGSVSDSYTSYDRDIEGASASIQKTVGFGPVDTVNWLSPSSRLIMGIPSAEIAIRSSAFGEVLSPTNCNLKAGSDQGSSRIDSIHSDGSVYFVQRSGTKVYSLGYDVSGDRHSPIDLNMYNQQICDAGIKRIAITHQPETRIWAVMDDGEMRILTYEPAEDVSAWSRWTMEDSSGASYASVEDIAVLPGDAEDRVYLAVSRLTGLQSEGGGGGGGGGSDLIEGGALGPNLIQGTSTGGGTTFDSNLDGWTVTEGTLGGDVEWRDNAPGEPGEGKVYCFGGQQGSSRVSQQILTIGNDYYIEADIIVLTGEAKLQLGTGIGSGLSTSSSGFLSNAVYNVGSSFAYCVANDNNDRVYFDNVVVKEILPGMGAPYPGADGGSPGGGGGGGAGTDGEDGGNGGDGLVVFVYNNDEDVVSYSSGSGSWTVPVGVTSIRAMATGGGAGGGKGTWAVGGGSGAYVETTLTVIENETIAYVVGSGGAGATSEGYGANGGDSSFTYNGETYTAGGGSGDSSGGATSIPAGSDATALSGSTGGAAAASAGGGGGGAPGGSGSGEDGIYGSSETGGKGGDGSAGDAGGAQSVDGEDGSIVSSAEDRYLVKMARFKDSLGGSSSKHFDFFVDYVSPGSKAGIPTLDSLDHLEGETVSIWADGQSRGTAVVSGGEITVSDEWVNVAVGLPYYAYYKSSKLRYGRGSVLNERKKIYNTGLVLSNYAPGSLTVGQDTTTYGSMPLIEDGTDLDQNTTLTEYDEIPFEFDGYMDTDARITMKATGPVTVLAVTYSVDAKDSSASAIAALTG